MGDPSGPIKRTFGVDFTQALTSHSQFRGAADPIQGYRRNVVWLIKEDFANDGDPRLEQAEYFRRELSGLRAQAETDLARNYIELQQVRNSGLTSRAAYVERIIRALECELATLERLGDGIYRSL